MKRTLFVFVGLLVIGFLFISAVPFVGQRFRRALVSSPVQSLVSVAFDFGDRFATVSSIPASTAFDALVAASAKEQLELKTKQYDFGVFVEQIGPRANTKEKSWIYFVNGKAGTVAADKQSVVSGDIVEWRYVQPVFE